MKTAPVLIAFVMLLALPGCPQADRPIPSRTVPHRLAADVDAEIYVRTSSGDFQKASVMLPSGWYVAAPEIVEGK